MDSLNRPPRSRNRSRLAAPAPGLKLEALEDRVVPSSSIPLSGVGFKPLGGTIIAANPALPTLPVAGRVTAIGTPAIPLDTTSPAYAVAANTLYAGSPGGGLAKSVDGGATWTFLTDNLPDAAWTPVTTGGNAAAGNSTIDRTLSVGAVGVSPFDSNLVLVGLGQTTGGPNDSTGTGLLRSTDGGVTFSLIQGPNIAVGMYNGPAFNSLGFTKFVFHPTDPNIVFAVVNGGALGNGANPSSGVYRSTDKGATWVNVSTNITGGILTSPVSDFVLDPNNPAVGYIAVAGGGTASQNGVFRSANFQTTAVVGGVPVTTQTAPGSINFSAVLGGSGSTVVGGGTLVWVKLAIGRGINNLPSRIYVLSASSSNISDQLFRSDTSGLASFVRLDPLPNPTFEGSSPTNNLILLADPTDPNRLFFGGRGTGAIQLLTNADYNPDPGAGPVGTPNYVNLTPVSTGSPTTMQVVRDLRFDDTGAKDAVGRPISPGRLIVATDAGLYRLQAPNNGVTTNANYTSGSVDFVSLNGAVGPKSLLVQQYFSNAIPARSDNRILGGTYLNGQSVFQDNGPYDPASSVPAQVANYNALYGEAAPAGGADARGTTGPAGSLVFSQTNTNLAYRYSPLTSLLDVNAAGRLQRSADAGNTWVTSPLTGLVNPGALNAFLADPSPQITSQESRLFLGTDVVNVSTDGGQTFSQFGPDLPFVTTLGPVITAMGMSRDDPNTIFVAVSDRIGPDFPFNYGAGIYRWTVGTQFWKNVTPGATDQRMPPEADQTMGAVPVPPDPVGGVAGVRQFVNDPTNRQIVYAVTVSTAANRIIRATNGQATQPALNPTLASAQVAWANITFNLPAGATGVPGLSVFSLALDPNLTNINPGNPGDPVNQSDDNLYIGTSIGVYKLTNPTLTTSTWSRLFGTGTTANGPTGNNLVAGELPDVAVRDVELNTDQGVLSVATFGRGIWQVQIRPFVRGQVFLDQNGNGTLDAPADTPLAGVRVLAININNPASPVVVADRTTAANGEYIFRDLPAATYQFIPDAATTLLFDATTKYDFTSSPIVQPVTATTTLNAQNLFVFQRDNISGLAYIDTNGDGVREAGEPAAAGFAVTLVPGTGAAFPAGVVPPTVTTAADGSYTFTGVGPLRPTLTGPSVPFPAGYRVSLSKAGYTTTQTPVQTGALASAVNLTDAANQANTRVGVFQFGTLSGTVFTDTNGDGVKQAAEAGRAGVTVNLLDAASGKLLGTTVSSATGAYTFGNLTTGLTAGSYRVQAVDPANTVETSAPLAAVTIFSGVNTPNLNVGLFDGATVTGFAFEDANGDGVREPNEVTTVPGLTVSLIDPTTNAVVVSTTTNGLGGYTFSNVFPLQRPGNTVPYKVRLTAPLDLYAQSTPDGTALLTSGGTTASPGTDVGVFRDVTVSGFAFEDINGNGTQDAGEPGLAGGPVSLLNSATGAVLYTTTTDANGNFLFTSVGPAPQGSAFRVGANPVGFFQTTANPPDFITFSGTPVSGFSIGLFRGAVFSGVVFNDVNGDGVLQPGEAGLAGQTVQLVNNATGGVQTALTDASGAYSITAGPGNYLLTNVVPGGFVQTSANPPAVTVFSGQRFDNQNFGDFALDAVTAVVFQDFNGNGVRDNGDTPFAGFAVQLVTAAGAVVAQGVTDANGAFTAFNVGPGAYRLQVLPRAGFVASTPTSVAFGTQSGTGAGGVFGFFAQGGIAGQVYEDLDRSGTLNAADIGSAGFTLQLFNAANVAVASTVSDAAGNFGFGGLAPGVYQVRIVGRQGYQVLSGGTQTVGIVSGTAAVTTPVAVLRLASVQGSVFLDPNRDNIREGFEHGVPAGLVGLFDANGTQVATQTTDADGRYAFFGVQAGSFTVRLITSPGGFQPTGPAARTLNLSVGSNAAGNAFTGVDFGVTGRKRFALAADGGGGPRVQVYDAQTGGLLQDFFAYEVTFSGGVRVAEADVNGDGVDDLIVVAGKGGGPRVRVFDGVNQSILYDYFAYEPTFRDGLYVTAGDVNGDGFADIITGTDSGGGPRVTVFSGKTGTLLADYFAYDSSFRGGVRVGAGDTNGDGVAEILTAPGVGGPPLVVIWGGPQLANIGSFNAFDPSYTGGVYLSGSSGNSAGLSNIYVGSGVIGDGSLVPTPVVRVFNGQTFNLDQEIEAFPGGTDPNGFRGEVRVASFDRNGDNASDIALVTGPGSPPRFRVLDGITRRQIGDEIAPFEDGFRGGVFIG